MPRVQNRSGRMMVALLLVVTVLAMGIAGISLFFQFQERAQRAAMESELTLVRQERDSLRVEATSAANAKSQLESELTTVRQDLADSKKQLAEALNQQTTLSQSLDAFEKRKEEIGSLSATIEQMTEELTTVRREREQLEVKVANLQEERTQLEQQLAESEDEKEVLRVQLVDMQEVPSVELGRVVVSTEQDLPKLRIPRDQNLPIATSLIRSTYSETEPAHALSTSAIKGQVLVINTEYDFIVMDVGKNQGLAIGQKFQVVRGADVIGTVKVEKVYDDLSAAAVLNDTNIDFIREGDRVIAL